MKTREDMQAWLSAGMPIDEEQEAATEFAVLSQVCRSFYLQLDVPAGVMTVRCDDCAAVIGAGGIEVIEDRVKGNLDTIGAYSAARSLCQWMGEHGKETEPLEVVELLQHGDQPWQTIRDWAAALMQGSRAFPIGQIKHDKGWKFTFGPVSLNGSDPATLPEIRAAVATARRAASRSTTVEETKAKTTLAVAEEGAGSPKGIGFRCRCVVSGIFEPFKTVGKFHAEMQEFDSLLKTKAGR